MVTINMNNITSTMVLYPPSPRDSLNKYLLFKLIITTYFYYFMDILPDGGDK